MIYEVRTYQFKPREANAFIEAFGNVYEYRQKFSPLSGIFYTDIGKLNQVIQKTNIEFKLN